MSWRHIVLVPLAVLPVVAACRGGDDTAETDAPVTSPSTSMSPASSTGAAPTPTTVVAGVTAAPSTAAVTTATPTTAVTTTTVPEVVGVAPVGFGTEHGVVTAADGTVCEVCLWVAATAEERAQGLMGVTDLGGADGMVFVWDAPTDGNFWMHNTPTPLSIAFFAADGSFVSGADMTPCLGGDGQNCIRYGASGSYVAAVEVPIGGLAAIGIGAGSRLDLLGTPCDPAP